ncbi:MAG: protein-glutamate O-methyltransferase CheR [Nitrospinae bacterium]|nr:protein-glutamate O-methyltransferase CheR [Nitrospinota bacterium]
MTISTNDFQYISKLVLDLSAIVLEPGKEYLVESRIQPLAKKEGLDSIEDLVKQLRSGPQNGLRSRVVDAMTTNETSFFRDIHPFETLKKFVIPDLIKKREAARELNIWCGASSSGQEPYTLTMLLRENFPQLQSWKINYISSDISHEMLDRCKKGIFSQLEINRGLPATLMVKYFERHGTEWQIKEDLRKMIEFRYMNLSENWPIMPGMDLVMLRNVLIYFDVDMKKNILNKIQNLLRPDGYLFLGAAETTLNLNDSFERMDYKQSGCYRIREGQKACNL